MAIEVVLVVLVVATLFVGTLMALEGLLGVLGAVRIERCPSCDHLIPASGGRTCPYCRHERGMRLLHLAGHTGSHPPTGRAPWVPTEDTAVDAPRDA